MFNGLGLVIGFYLLFVSQVVSAADSTCEYETPYQEQTCNSREWARLDKELNLIWKKALAKTPKDGTSDDFRRERAQLLKSQRAWLAFREVDCQFYGALHGGGNIYISNYAVGCEISMTKERIRFLKQVIGND